MWAPTWSILSWRSRREREFKISLGADIINSCAFGEFLAHFLRIVLRCGARRVMSSRSTAITSHVLRAHLSGSAIPLDTHIIQRPNGSASDHQSTIDRRALFWLIVSLILWHSCRKESEQARTSLYIQVTLLITSRGTAQLSAANDLTHYFIRLFRVSLLILHTVDK